MSLKVQAHHDNKVASKQRLSKPPVRDRPAITDHIHPATLIQRARFESGLLTPRDVLQLQRTIGNQAVLRLLRHAKSGELEARSSTKEVTQTKLATIQPGDEYEQEADRITERVMRTPEPQLHQTRQPDGEHKRLQTKHVGSIDSGQIPAPRSVHDVLGGAGEEPEINRIEIFDGKETMADWLPQTCGTVAEQAVVHPASPLAERLGANAVTVGQAVHLSSGLSRLETAEQQRVLAHEAVHVAQHSTPGPMASRPALETEAHQLTSRVLAGYAVQPRFHAGATTALADERGQAPKDKLDVALARKRREVLLRYKDILEGKRAAVTTERQDMRDRRQRLDDSMKEFLATMDQGFQMGLLSSKPPTVDNYRQKEQQQLAGLNRGPLTMEMTPTAVWIRARFQVRFEGLTAQQAGALFPTLEKNFQKGVRDMWSQTLSGVALGGRTFEMIPDLTLIQAKAARDQNFWLITVRPTDKGPMVYDGKTLGTAPGGLPTSVTDPLVDGGVMSIPPSHINLPETLGHETLHLFGMVDRYMTLPAQLSSTGKASEVALRETGGRKDPLGAKGGKILEEDLGFVLEEFGVYHREEISTPLSTAGMSYNEVLAELSRADEIIHLGRDPNSLIRERKDFIPEMIKQAEDLE